MLNLHFCKFYLFKNNKFLELLSEQNELVLSPGTIQYISALSFPANIVAIPVITIAINADANAITDPIISTILSFSAGGRIDQPTTVIIGDGSRLGGRNREWISNDSQLIATVQMAGANSNLWQ